ncbi:MAG: outer membrane protein assembly factor BamE [Gammaproteobacteria bacterium]|nr:outer membrane protein assembly factor BamE [Gammaproteobacteria bacterium]
MKSRFIPAIILLALIVSSAGCVYRMDIHQGSRIDSQVADQLELGMTRRQVEFLLGEPSIVNLYRPDTWHYVLYYKSGKDKSEQKRVLILKFQDDLLTEITGNRNLLLDS